MESLRQYILCVVSSALICSILVSLVNESFSKEVMKLLCGIFLTVTMLFPFIRTDGHEVDRYTLPYLEEGKIEASAGINMAEDALRQGIKEKTEAYILDKAAELGAEITAEITLSTAYAPEEAFLHGCLSPYQKMQLETILEKDIGIPKENQRWTG